MLGIIKAGRYRRAMASSDNAFAQYCCELLSSVGPCVAKRMFGGFGISTGGLTLALVADLGAGQKLWLKADETTRGLYEAAGCERFTYLVKGLPKQMNYYSAPEEAMESGALMAQWARQALDCALKAAAGRKPPRPRPKPTSSAKPARPKANRATAPAPRPSARRKSARG
jgi:DNA transformation protein and related proteins